MRVAIVGSGAAGLGALWLLNEYSDHDVHVYEADSRVGGHANTVEFLAPLGSEVKSTPVDTGFVSIKSPELGKYRSSYAHVEIVLNPTTYPNFLRFLKLKNVPLTSTEMTFSVSRDRGKFEWAGDNINTIFCQKKRLFDPRMWALIYDVLRFNACAPMVLQDTAGFQEMTIGEYLDKNNYSASFRDDYLIPMTAAVWSTSPDKCALGFPARTLIQFMHNHHLLQITGKPSWLTIKGGSITYVDSILSRLRKDRLHLSSPVRGVETTSTGHVRLVTDDGKDAIFDHVILACHSDTALQILEAGNATPDESRILNKFSWNRNSAVLHTDARLMPKSRLAWSCWNYLSESALDGKGRPKANIDRVSLTYWMNDLQHLSEEVFGPIFVTLNPPFEPCSESIRGRWAYDHPVLDSEAVEAHSEMHKIQNKRGISFAGAYLRYGFHEDAFTSGMKVAVDSLGVKPPFAIQNPDRPSIRVSVSQLFALLESTGFRAACGFVLSLIVKFFHVYISLFVDIDDLKF